MSRNNRYIAVILALFCGFVSCSKLDETLVLNEDYLSVADALEYCQGNCNQVMDWEDSEILVSGNIPDVTNDSIMMNYFEKSRFYLADIRNGMFIEILVEDDKDAIFEKISNLDKKDKVYIKGTTSSVIVSEGDDCQKGVVINLVHSDNININL